VQIQVDKNSAQVVDAFLAVEFTLALPALRPNLLRHWLGETGSGQSFIGSALTSPIHQTGARSDIAICPT
jgi:hypothetical protein